MIKFVRPFLISCIALLVFSVVFPKAYAVPAPKCNDAKPSDTPRIQRIDAKPKQIKLYTSSVAENNSYYYIAYGYQPGDERFGVEFPFGAMSGHSVKYVVNHLSPNTIYYFKARGGNGCKPGNWSAWVKARTPVQGILIYNY